MGTNILDGLLYYLSHLGRLSLEKFKDAAKNLTEGQPRFKDSTYLNTLARLGHLDYDPMKLDRRIVIAPSVLVETAVKDRYVFVGSRTPDFLEEIERCISEAGGKLERISEQYAPTSIVLSELSETSFAEIESLGIHISCAFSARLSSILPSPERTSFLKDEVLLPDSINRFNIRTLEYESDNYSLRSDGLYEIPKFGRNVYVLKSGTDQRIVPRDWGEWLFLNSRSRTVGLISYERQSQTWCVNRKLHVPLTLDRCATLCSGFPPQLRDDLFCYADVPAGIAYRLTKALYQNWEVV